MHRARIAGNGPRNDLPAFWHKCPPFPLQAFSLCSKGLRAHAGKVKQFDLFICLFQGPGRFSSQLQDAAPRHSQPIETMTTPAPTYANSLPAAVAIADHFRTNGRCFSTGPFLKAWQLKAPGSSGLYWSYGEHSDGRKFFVHDMTETTAAAAYEAFMQI